MTAAYANAAAEAFRTTLEEFMGDERDDDSEVVDESPAELGRRAALLASSNILWRKHLGPLLETADAQLLLRVRSRQAVSDLARRGRLLALPTRSGQKLYPAFQFDRSGRPYEAMRPVLAAFGDAVITPHTLASWFRTPQSLLGDETPVAWLGRGGDEETLVEAARRTARRFER
jgi:hypothetical protein